MPTCIGCGAMALAGSCESGCGEEKLVLVRADAHDTLTELDLQARRSIDALSPVFEDLTCGNPGTDADHAHSYARLRAAARAALPSAGGSRAPAGEDVREPAEPVTAWSCPGCGGLDAPQPCLGICLWRPVEWIDRDSYERERAKVLPTLEAAERLRSLACRLASVTPRSGTEELSLRAFGAEAEQVLHALLGRRASRSEAVRPTRRPRTRDRSPLARRPRAPRA